MSLTSCTVCLVHLATVDIKIVEGRTNNKCKDEVITTEQIKPFKTKEKISIQYMKLNCSCMTHEGLQMAGKTCLRSNKVNRRNRLPHCVANSRSSTSNTLDG